MAAVTFTIADTPSGGVSVHTDFSPAVGKPCSAAQAAALDIIRRTRREFGLADMPPKGTAMVPVVPQLKEVDIDAVHRSRDRVVQAAS